MLSWQLTNTLTAFLIPPGLLIALLAAGLVVLRKRPRRGRLLILAATSALYLLSMPLTGTFLLRTWETPPHAGKFPDLQRAPVAQAIVVLGAGLYAHAPEYQGDTVATPALVRLRYAATLHRQTGLPVLVSGGSPGGHTSVEAQSMRQVLEQDFGVPVRWSEDQSANTLENARYSRQLLDRDGIQRIYLVTHAWHMPRARLAFEHAGFEVITAPTRHATSHRLSALDFVPDTGALLDSALFFREVIGTVWYRVRLLANG